MAYNRSDDIGFSSGRTINITTAGDYIFTISSDDGVIFWVDDVKYIDSWIKRSYTTESVIIQLAPGEHKLRLDYYEDSQNARLTFSCTLSEATPTPSDDGMRVGVTYYGDYQDWYGIPDSVLDRDFALFKEKGISIIVLPTFWNVLESSRGSYNSVVFSRLNHITDIAAQYGIKVVHNIHTWYTGTNVPSYVKNQRNAIINTDIRRAWLDFVRHYIQTLDKPNVESFQVFNELSWHSWSMNVSLEQFYSFSFDTYQEAKSVTSKPISARFAGDGTNGMETRMYALFDYFCVNYYDAYNEPSQLQSIIDKAKAQGKEVWVTEFGLATSDDNAQAQRYESNLSMFESKGIHTAICWWWSGLKGVGNLNYNIADGNGNPRPAFYVLVKYSSKND